MSEPRVPLDASESDVVAIVGAGPAGLMLANLLGQRGIRVDVYEAGAELIDYPRGVGMDDETLRTFQNIGLGGDVVAHTIPHQLLVFVDAKGRDLARLAPPTAEFGWPRRNGFVQPFADRVLLEGLARFPNVQVHWSSEVTGLDQDDTGVTVHLTNPQGVQSRRAAYVVGADGGSSQTRKSLGLSFDGKSSAQDWLVIDLRNDPLGRPGAWVYADPKRPYVSISIPHGIRRVEFMVLPGETEEQVVADAFVRKLLAPLIPETAEIDIIRRRVYTHHSRMAGKFRSGRVMLIGDAAHLMPVWQGQGYNSGIRDALNLSWKLALAVTQPVSDSLLDSYEDERRAHARAMIDLSWRVGSVVSVRNRAAAALRNGFFRAISVFPRIKTYIVTMKFKPMPVITRGALTRVGVTSGPPTVGRLFFQPTVTTVDGVKAPLDDVIGPWFSLIGWNNDPREILDDNAREVCAQLGVRLVWARPSVQQTETEAPTDLTLVGDIDGSMKRYFDDRNESFVLVRPDRIVAGASPAFAASDMIRGFADVIGLAASEREAATPSQRKETR